MYHLLKKFDESYEHINKSCSYNDHSDATLSTPKRKICQYNEFGLSLHIRVIWGFRRHPNLRRYVEINDPPTMRTPVSRANNVLSSTHDIMTPNISVNDSGGTHVAYQIANVTSEACGIDMSEG